MYTKDLGKTRFSDILWTFYVKNKRKILTKILTQDPLEGQKNFFLAENFNFCFQNRIPCIISFNNNIVCILRKYSSNVKRTFEWF